MKFFRILGTEGASAFEYLIVIGAIALVALGAFNFFGRTVEREVQSQTSAVRHLEGQSADDPLRIPDESAPPKPAANDQNASLSTRGPAGRRDGMRREGAGSTEGDEFTWADLLRFNFVYLIAIAGLVAVVGFVLARNKRRSRTAAQGSMTAKVEAIIAPPTRLLSLLRSNLTGRSPWTPRE